MRLYAQVVTPANIVTRTVESADPADLAARVNAILAGEAILGLVGIDLAGAGDGHTFVATLAFAPTTDSIGSPVFGVGGIAQVRCALAGSGEALLTGIDAMVTPTEPTVGGPFTVFDVISAGASKGTRVMVMKVYLALAISTFVGKRLGLVAWRGGSTALLGAANIISFDTTVFAGGLTLAAPQFLENTSGPSIIGNAVAVVVARVTAGGTMSVEIVRDPLGTPTPLGINNITLDANVYESISVEAFAPMEPLAVSIPNSKIGVRVTLSGAGDLLSAQLKICQI